MEDRHYCCSIPARIYLVRKVGEQYITSSPASIGGPRKQRAGFASTPSVYVIPGIIDLGIKGNTGEAGSRPAQFPSIKIRGMKLGAWRSELA